MAAENTQPIEEFVNVLPRRKASEVSRCTSDEFAFPPLDIDLKKLLRRNDRPESVIFYASRGRGSDSGQTGVDCHMCANKKELIEQVQVTGQTDTKSISRVKIKVVTRDAGLHRLADYTPRLKVLILDGSYVDSLRDLGSSLKSLETLSVVRCSLQSLDGIWGFRSLRTLIARDNSIKNPSPCSLVHKLAKLDLANNEIDEPTSFVFLKNCKHLKILDVAGNLFDNYRDTIKKLVPQIRVLDGESVKGVEAELSAIEEEESSENESDLTSEDEDLILFSELEESASLPVGGKREKCSALEIRERNKSDDTQTMDTGYDKMHDSTVDRKEEKKSARVKKIRAAERDLNSSSASTYLPTSEFDRLSMLDLSVPNVGDNRHQSLKIMPSKLSSGRAICGNLATSLRARNSYKNPFTLPGARVGSGAVDDNNDAKIN